MPISWVLPPVRDGRPAPDDLVQVRVSAAAFTASTPIEPGVTVREQDVGGVGCTVVEPAVPLRTLLYFHGGGYRLGAAAGWAAFGSRVANAADARVVLVDYRLAPEHPFPAALHDATAAYGALLDEGGGIVVGGDSAGGGLAASLVVACLGSGVTPPVGSVLISPWLDLTASGASYDSRAGTDQMFSRDSATMGAEGYLQGGDPKDPLASPLFADLSEFPPTLVFGGGAEVLLDDAVALAAALATTGRTVELHAVAGMQHVWPTLFPDLQESIDALDAMARFMVRVTRTAP